MAKTALEKARSSHFIRSDERHLLIEQLLGERLEKMELAQSEFAISANEQNLRLKRLNYIQFQLSNAKRNWSRLRLQGRISFFLNSVSLIKNIFQISRQSRMQFRYLVRLRPQLSATRLKVLKAGHFSKKVSAVQANPKIYSALEAFVQEKRKVENAKIQNESLKKQIQEIKEKISTKTLQNKPVETAKNVTLAPRLSRWSQGSKKGAPQNGK